MPIKRSEYLKPLSRDHHFSLLFGWKLRQGVKAEIAPERMAKYVAYFFPKVLFPHFEEEENCLFIFSDDMDTQKALQEHKDIRRMADELVADPAKQTNINLLELADRLDSHVRFEERILFPQLEISLSEEQLTAVSHNLSNSQPVKDEYTDEFWINKK